MQHPPSGRVQPVARAMDSQQSELRGWRPRSTDSWIEIISRPSSSSLSSAADEVVPSGLRVEYDSTMRRRRRAPPTLHFNTHNRPTSASGSSQEEYEESESESDRVLSSSNEGIQQSSPTSPALHSETAGEGEDNDDEDENTTAIGININSNQQCFTPQPNAFSHPPTSQSRSVDPVPGSYFPSTSPATRPASQRHSYPTQERRQAHTPYNIISPSHQADHDAALRASLSTLLSCAAAARSLPKTNEIPTARARPVTNARVEPSTLRMVPESALLGNTAPTSIRRRPSASPISASSSSGHAASATGQDKGKRKAAVVRCNSKDRRVVKKPRRVLNADESISPTLLTWVVSAGVLVLVSALSFSAGYAVGREAGAVEAGSRWAAVGGEGVNGCGKEIARSGLGLRRLRWGAGPGAVRV